MSDFLEDKRLLRLKIMNPKKMLQSSNQKSGRTWAITSHSENLGKVTRLRLVAIPRLCHTRWAVLTDHESLNTKNEANRPLRNGRLVSFLLFNSAFGRHRHWLRPKRIRRTVVIWYHRIQYYRWYTIWQNQFYMCMSFYPFLVLISASVHVFHR